MYVGTFSLQHGLMLVRVGVETDGLKTTARYATMYRDGKIANHSTTLAPDAHGAGPAAMAVIGLINDLRFAGAKEVANSFELVQATTNFPQSDLDAILQGVATNACIDGIISSPLMQ